MTCVDVDGFNNNFFSVANNNNNKNGKPTHKIKNFYATFV